MDSGKWAWQKWMQRSFGASGSAKRTPSIPSSCSLQPRQRSLLSQLPIVPRCELLERLKCVTPVSRTETVVAGWSDEVPALQLIPQFEQWQDEDSAAEGTEGPAVVQGVGNYPCLFHRRQSGAGRTDCEIYRVGYDRYIEWQRTENYSDTAESRAKRALRLHR